MILGLILGHQGDAVTRLLGVEGVNGRFNSRYLPISFSILAAFLVVSVLITPGRTQSEKKSATSGQSKT